MDPLILVVEDNLKILENIVMLLEFNNYRVITAFDGESALLKLDSLENPPALILSDIIMPKMDGYDFFSAVSSDLRLNHIPFIFVTARSQPEDLRLAKLLGVDDYITKPFKEEELLKKIQWRIKQTRTEVKINENLKNFLRDQIIDQFIQILDFISYVVF